MYCDTKSSESKFIMTGCVFRNVNSGASGSLLTLSDWCSASYVEITDCIFDGVCFEGNNGIIYDGTREYNTVNFNNCMFKSCCGEEGKAVINIKAISSIVFSSTNFCTVGRERSSIITGQIATASFKSCVFDTIGFLEIICQNADSSRGTSLSLDNCIFNRIACGNAIASTQVEQVSMSNCYWTEGRHNKAIVYIAENNIEVDFQNVSFIAETLSSCSLVYSRVASIEGCYLSVSNELPAVMLWM